MEMRYNPSDIDDETVQRDIALMVETADGSESAFATLYLSHQDRLYNFFYGLCCNSAVASDLKQETFLRIWKFRQRYTTTGTFKAYVFGFARNIWLEHCRRQRRQFDIELHGAAAKEMERFMASPQPEPDVKAGHTEIQSDVFEVLKKLPEDQRMVFVLRSIEGFSLEEVASIMQCPVNTVRSRQITALKKLRKSLTHRYGNEVPLP